MLQKIQVTCLFVAFYSSVAKVGLTLSFPKNSALKNKNSIKIVQVSLLFFILLVFIRDHGGI